MVASTSWRHTSPPASSGGRRMLSCLAVRLAAPARSWLGRVHANESPLRSGCLSLPRGFSFGLWYGLSLFAVGRHKKSLGVKSHETQHGSCARIHCMLGNIGGGNSTDTGCGKIRRRMRRHIVSTHAETCDLDSAHQTTPTTALRL